MESLPVTPERKAEFEEYAHRRGQDPAAALDQVLADYLVWEKQESQEAMAGIRRGFEDLEAGRTSSAEEVFERLLVKHGFPSRTDAKR